MTRGDIKAAVDTPVLIWFAVSKVQNVDERKRRAAETSQENLIVTFTGWEIIHDEASNADLVNRLLPAITGVACTGALR